jgi:hypothetical protein
MCLGDQDLQVLFLLHHWFLVGEDKVSPTVASEVGLFRDSSGCSPITSGLFLGGRVGLPCLGSSVPTTVTSEVGLFSDSSCC